MLPATIEKALNEQMKKEMYSSYLYLSVASWFDSKNQKGFAHWMKSQAKEEWEHAMKFYEHIDSRGGRAVLEALEKPPASWTSPLKAFEAALEHEKKITAAIISLKEMADKEKDHASHTLLQWFVDEQVEEEQQVADIVDKIRQVEDNPAAMMMLDAKMGERK